MSKLPFTAGATQVQSPQHLARSAWRRAQEATDPAEARRWLDRAYRLAPEDGLVATALAGAMLQHGEFDAAAALFRILSDRYNTADAWAGLAACAHVRGERALAERATAAALRCNVPTPTITALADAVAGASGWCGLTTEGVLSASMPMAEVWLDGSPLPLGRQACRLTLPYGWRQAGALDVSGANGPLLGSPLPVRAFAALEGFVEARNGGIEGWAWYPADPARNPTLRIEGPLAGRDVLLTDPAEALALGRPLARPRRFVLTVADVGALGEPLSVRGPDSRHVLGSPLEPGLESRAARGGPGFAPVWADVVGPPAAPGPGQPPVDVIIPVYRGLDETLACLSSVLAARLRGSRVIVVDDASPDQALTAALDRLSRRRRIVLIRLAENRGFPGAANAGLKAAVGHDAVLLNSDTLVPPGWLERLRTAAYSALNIGSVTPLTNDGTIVSYPNLEGANPAPDLAGTAALDSLAQRANPGQVTDLPVGVGFCLYLRRDCLDQVGLLREDLFAQGYGEENDWCLRARHHGWRNVAAADVFVAHVGATSFGSARAHLIRRNSAILGRLHPGYDALVARHIEADPLGPARRRMDALRWAKARRAAGAVVLITHGRGGGVERAVQDRAAAVGKAGLRPVILRPGAQRAVHIEQPGGGAFPNLVFSMPGELRAVIKLLRADRPQRVELHHQLGHHPAIAQLAARLGAEAVSIMHDYARFCPRIALMSREQRYCGEPDLAGCEACIADLGSLLENGITVPELLAQSANELGLASQVVAPSADTAIRLRRHFPGVQVAVEPWEDDALLPPLSPAPRDGPVRVVIVGAIGVEKGYDVVLACARDARARGLPIAFTVVGFTCDDERLMAAGPVFVTGRFAKADAIALIRAQHGQLAFIPSVLPETWCFALTQAWQAGLAGVVFDLGAQAERVHNTGRGWVLPFGFNPKDVNNALLWLATSSSASQSATQLNSTARFERRHA